MVKRVAGVVDQLFCGWWQLKHVLPLVPRFWKNDRLEVVTGPPGKYVVVCPLMSKVVLISGRVAGTLPSKMVGSRGTLCACCRAPANHAGIVEVVEVD